MQSRHAIGIFCEDIREEKNEVYSLIGVMPDNINVPATPGMLPKLAIYARFHVPPTLNVGAIDLKLRFANGVEVALRGGRRNGSCRGQRGSGRQLGLKACGIGGISEQLEP